MSGLRDKGIQTGDYFYPIHLQPLYRKAFGYKEGDYPVSEMIYEQTIALPFFNDLEEQEIDYIIESIKMLMKEL
jgi:perosamine synthetase